MAYANYETFSTAQKFFQITREEAFDLFGACDPKTNRDRDKETPKMVAKRIRKFVERRQKLLPQK